MFQPAFNLDIQQDASLDDFSAEGYAQILTAVRRLYAGELPELFIFGTKGVGKTHLALSIYNAHHQYHKSAISLSFSDLVDDDDVSALMGLETFDIVILDDIQCIEHSYEWQEALFHLINRMREQSKPMVFLANNPARELEFELIDLKTRLSLAPALRLPDGSDIAGRTALIKMILARKNWRLPDEILSYLIQEGPHNASDIVSVLDSISPLLKHLNRQVPKKIIDEAKNIIQKETILLEINSYVLDDADET